MQTLHTASRFNSRQRNFVNIFQKNKGLADKLDDLLDQLEHERQAEEEELKQYQQSEKHNLEDALQIDTKRLEQIHERTQLLVAGQQQIQRQRLEEMQCHQLKKAVLQFQKILFHLHRVCSQEVNPLTISDILSREEEIEHESIKVSPHMEEHLEYEKQQLSQLEEISKGWEIITRTLTL